MAHGHPDYGIGAPTSVIYMVQDLSELAARLGSVDTFDRRGNVIWVNNFENGIHGWIMESFGVGNAISWSAESARNGSFCLRMFVPRTAGNWTRASYRLPILVPTETGVEFCFDTPFGTYRYEIHYTLYDGEKKHEAKIQNWAPGHIVRYYGSDELYHDLEPPYYYEREAHLYHHVKLVIDPLTYKYVRLIIDNSAWDMKDISYFTDTEIGAPSILPGIEIENGLALADIAPHVDHVIITQNEP